jgi:hypothetical protein
MQAGFYQAVSLDKAKKWQILALLAHRMKHLAFTKMLRNVLISILK